MDEIKEDGNADDEEPRYCYCNQVSYGTMIACDADNCAREWFHLRCVGLTVPLTKVWQRSSHLAAGQPSICLSSHIGSM